MSRSPCTIDPGRPLSEAHALMRARRIKHLPVVRDGVLVGIVSQRDLFLIESLPDVVAEEVPVEDTMLKDVFVVAPSAPLGQVCATMADRRIGSAVVMENDRVIGVFTVTDACRALAALLGHGPGRKRV